MTSHDKGQQHGNRRKITAAGVAVGVSALGAAHVPAAGALTDVHNGGMTWAISDTLMTYLSTPIANGRITATDGAIARGGALQLPIVPTQLTATDGPEVIPLAGEVHIKAHPGLGPTGYGLDLHYSDFTLRIDGTHGELLVDFTLSGVTGKGFGEMIDGRTGDDVVLATFTLPTDVNSVDSVSEAQVPMFAGQGAVDSLARYEVGDELAPADISLNGGALPEREPTFVEKIQESSVGPVYDAFGNGLSRSASAVAAVMRKLGINPMN